MDETRYFLPENHDDKTEIELPPLSPRLLKLALQKLGVYEKEETEEKSGAPIRWSWARVTRLAEEFNLGIRNLSIVTIDKTTNKHGEFLQTKINTVLAYITTTSPEGKRVRLCQFVQEGTMQADEYKQPITATLVLGEVEQKRGKSSVSGKLNIRENEDTRVALEREMKEELGLKPDQYTMISKSTKEYDAEKGRGYPGLLTEMTATHYQIEIDPSAYRGEYREETDPIYNPETKLFETKTHIFRWEEVVE